MFSYAETVIDTSVPNRGGGEDGGVPDNNNHHYNDLSDNEGRHGEVEGGHFAKGPWLSLCSAIDSPIPEEEVGEKKGENIPS